MRILAILPSYRPSAFNGTVGGGEISNRALLEGLAGRGHQLTVVTLNAGGSGSFSENGVDVIDLAEHGGIVPWVLSRSLFSRRIRRFISKRPEALPDVLLTGTEALGVAIKLRGTWGVPLALFVRAYENFDSPTGWKQKLKRFLKRITLGDFGPDAVAKVDMLLPNSEFMADYCSSHITGSVPARVVYPPLNVDVIGEPAESRVEVVSMVGTGEKKGTHVVHALAAEFPQLRFRVVGYPGLAPGEELERGNLTLVGWCDVQAEFRKRADLVLVPSLWEEPFGRVAIEALAAGKWLLVSDIGGLREAVSYQAELMAPAGDLVAWREKLAIMVEEPERCRTAWRAAASEFESFKAERQIDALEQALTELTHWQKST